MFDKTFYIRPEVTSRQYTTITENRAPTDASVELLKEMEAAARDKIYAALKIDTNIVKGKAIIIEDFSTGTFNCYIECSVNGNPLKAEFDLFRYEFKSKHDLEHAIIEKLRDKLILMLSSELTFELFKSGTKGFRS